MGMVWFSAFGEIEAKTKTKLILTEHFEVDLLALHIKPFSYKMSL